MIFEYNIQTVSLRNIDIEDIGNCALITTDVFGRNEILIIETSLGTSRVFKYGPFIPDLDKFLDSMSCSFTRVEFSDKKLIKIINNFISNFNIIDVKQISKSEALRLCKDIISYMSQDRFW